MVNIRNAAFAFNSLNGVICIYKPSCVSIKHAFQILKTKLCTDLNDLPDRPLEQRVEIIGKTTGPMEVKLVPNYADHPLVCGPRYIHEDFRLSYATHLGLFSSGVFLVGINEGTKLTHKIHASRPTRAFKVQGQLGKATDTYFWNGKTVERASFGHVTREKIDKVVAHMQSAHQKSMFLSTGLHMDSQSAYDLACQGLIRPANNNIPVIYGIKCVHFKPPDFTLEIHSVNEYDQYLWTLIHDLGIQLKTAAHCTAVQCIREGKFDLSKALLRKHWTLEYIIENIRRNTSLLKEYENEIMYPAATMKAY